MPELAEIVIDRVIAAESEKIADIMAKKGIRRATLVVTEDGWKGYVCEWTMLVDQPLIRVLRFDPPTPEQADDWFTPDGVEAVFPDPHAKARVAAGQRDATSASSRG